MAATESIKSANFKLGVIISNNGRRRRTATRKRKITDQHPAFATALDTGQQPGHFRFTQGSMRKHLYKCITNGCLTIFPAKPRKCRGVISTDILELYCSCRMPEIIPMVMCTRCEEWYHNECVCVPKVTLENSSVPWYCTKCML